MMKKLFPVMLALAATAVQAQDFSATPAEGATILGTDLNSITLTWPEGTQVEVDEWGYMEIKTLESYEASEEEDIFWWYVGYGFADTWEVNGSSVTVHPDYFDITEDGTYVVVIEAGSFWINGSMSERIALKYDVVSDAAPKIDLNVQNDMVEGMVALQIPEGYTLSSVADDAQIVVTDGEDYVCDAAFVKNEGDIIYLAPQAELEEGRYYISIMDGTFLFNDDTIANAYIYSRFTASAPVAIEQVEAEQNNESFNLMGQRTHHIGQGLHIVNGKVVVNK